MKTAKYLRPWSITEDFTKLPNQILHYTAISLEARVIWAIMARFSGGKTYCFPGIDLLSTELGLGRDKVMKAIGELVEQKFLERVRRGRGQSNVYHFKAHAVFAEIFSNSPDEIPETDLPDDPDEEAGEEKEKPERIKKSVLSTSRSRNSRLLEVGTVDFQKSVLSTSLKGIRKTLEELNPPPTSSADSDSKSKAEEEETVSTEIQRHCPADPEIARQIIELVRGRFPGKEISAEDVAEAVKTSVPPRYKVNHAGYFLKSVLKVVRDPGFIQRIEWRAKLVGLASRWTNNPMSAEDKEVYIQMSREDLEFVTRLARPG